MLSESHGFLLDGLLIDPGVAINYVYIDTNIQIEALMLKMHNVITLIGRF